MSSPRGASSQRAPLRASAAFALCGCLLLAAAGRAAAQDATSGGERAAWQIASAVLAAPAPLRAGAEVRAWVSEHDLVVLRPGTNDIICLADRPDGEAFNAACYHASLEPFMERGRALRRAGVDGAARDETRWAEIEAGTLPMPATAMVYNLRLPSEDFDPATVDPATGNRLHALYIRGATTASTGLPALPGDGPWLMAAGTPSAHVMIALPPKVQP